MNQVDHHARGPNIDQPLQKAEPRSAVVHRTTLTFGSLDCISFLHLAADESTDDSTSIRLPVCRLGSHTANFPPRARDELPPSMHKTVEVRRPRSSQQVSVSWEETQDSVTRHTSRLQFEVAECVETKTVTTTTTTKRSYPPLFVREPRHLSSLDSRNTRLPQGPSPGAEELYSISGTTMDSHGPSMMMLILFR